ncbi:thrombospondin type 3 repeat-containing protein, partial [Patescibacteria group bacterium]|nr:thrombospondin type 3 repeat-containing protein [Patescibacteria group bacterium]MBU1953543.1 thrombospondin type 3 repeat-containing protein [Patescibacteria group bacterium]
DGDKLSDYYEVIIYKTDPLKSDTDLDDFSDYTEIKAGTDPLDPKSYPVDENKNGVPDAWEKENKISVQTGFQDTDGDGVSDKLEFQYGTNPNLRDSDGDGFTDAEEILEYHSDPLDPASPGKLSNLGVMITNFLENQLVADITPMIKGVAPYGYPVRIVLRNDYGHEKILGSATVDENNVFVFQTLDPLRDGRYMLVARSLQADKKRIVDSDPVHIIIDSTLDVAGPVPRKLAGEEISDEVLLKNLKITIRDKRPVLSGETEYGNKVTAVWRSVVTSSVLIADSVTGEFEVQAPREMAIGDHEVWVTAVRKKDNAQSDTVKLNFTIREPGLGEEIFRGVTEEIMPSISLPLIGNLGVFIKEQGFLAWLLFGVILFLIVALGYYIHLVRKK